MKKPTNKEIHLQNEYNRNPFSICLYTGIPNRINTHKVPSNKYRVPPPPPNTKIKQNHTNANYVT